MGKDLATVKFYKNFGAFKSGETTECSYPVALKWAKIGVVEVTAEISDYAKKVGVKLKKNADK